MHWHGDGDGGLVCEGVKWIVGKLLQIKYERFCLPIDMSTSRLLRASSSGSSAEAYIQRPAEAVPVLIEQLPAERHGTQPPSSRDHAFSTFSDRGTTIMVKGD